MALLIDRSHPTATQVEWLNPFIHFRTQCKIRKYISWIFNFVFRHNLFGTMGSGVTFDRNHKLGRLFQVVTRLPALRQEIELHRSNAVYQVPLGFFVGFGFQTVPELIGRSGKLGGEG